MAYQPNPSSGRRAGQINSRDIAWLLLGLLIGLLIGWVFWPVEWSDAGLEDLRPDARAYFISATADAYVASGGQDPTTALARMQSFADPQAAVYAAIAFFQQSGDPKRAIREVNLRSLASALDAQRPGASFTTSPTDSAAGPEMGWLNWLLGVLAALLLLVGGLWIGRRLLVDWRNRAPAQPARTPSGWVPPLPPTTSPQPSQPAPASPGDGWQPLSPADSSTPLATNPSAVQMETWDRLDDIPPFAEKSFPATGPGIASDQPLKETEAGGAEIRRITPTTGAPPSPLPVEEGDLPLEMDGFLDYAEEEDEDEDETQNETWVAWRSVEDDPPIRRVVAAQEEEEEEDDEEWYEDDSEEDGLEADDELPEDEEGEMASASQPQPGGSALALPLSAQRTEKPDDEGSGIVHTVQNVLSGWRRGDKESNPVSRGGPEITSFTAEYNSGIQAYVQTFTITANGQPDGPVVGACGMAVSEEFDKGAAHSDKVHILDVWLYDADPVRTLKQYLVSPGMETEALAGQAKSAGTITGEPLEIAPGVSFRIASKNLILECKILRADFLTPGAQPSPLRTVRAELRVRAAK